MKEQPPVRVSARVVPVATDDACLLLLERGPGGAPCWNTIGGGVGPTEALRATAICELREETGIRATEPELVGPVHRLREPGTYRSEPCVHDATFFALKGSRDNEASFAALEPDEIDSVLQAGWLTPDQLDADGRMMVPDMAAILARAVEAVR